MTSATNQTKNCHYISRFLTLPWEIGQRQLRFYDFGLDEFDEKSSKNLFAEGGLNSQRAEEWLRDNIETPLAHVRPTLVAGDSSALGDWKFYRAAVLMLMMQGVRGPSRDRQAPGNLDELSALADAELDNLVAANQTFFDLRLVFSRHKEGLFAPLFFPSSGLFPIPLADTASIIGWSIGVAIPIDLNCGLVVTPHEKREKLDLSTLPDSLSNLSIGLAPSTRVVLPPNLSHGDAELRDVLKDVRRNSQTLFDSIGRSNQLVVEMFQKVGLSPEVDLSGRIFRPEE